MKVNIIVTGTWDIGQLVMDRGGPGPLLVMTDIL